MHSLSWSGVRLVGREGIGDGEGEGAASDMDDEGLGWLMSGAGQDRSLGLRSSWRRRALWRQ